MRRLRIAAVAPGALHRITEMRERGLGHLLRQVLKLAQKLHRHATHRCALRP
jgi:hypothetical protein